MANLQDLKSGMIGQSGGNLFIQKAIRFFTRSIFSHSFLIIEGPYKILSCLETTETIISLTDIFDKMENKDYIEVWKIKASQAAIDGAASWAYMKYSGKWYGYTSYLYYIWRFFTGSKKISKRLTDGTTCTELVCNYICMIGPEFSKLFEGIDLNTVTPQDLNEIMEANPALFEKIGWLKEKK